MLFIGDVYICNTKNANQKKIISSHHEGRVLGLEYVPDKYVIFIIVYIFK